MQQPKPKHKRGPKPAPARDILKARFLETMGKTYNVTWSAEAAGINRRTVQNWRNDGYLTAEEEQEAYQQFQDFIAAEVVKRGLLGTQEPMISNGRFVKDEHGNIMTHLVVDKRLLARLAERHLPGYAPHSEQHVTVDHTTNGIPNQYLLQIDARDLTDDEWAILKNVADSVQARKAVKVIESAEL